MKLINLILPILALTTIDQTTVDKNKQEIIKNTAFYDFSLSNYDQKFTHDFFVKVSENPIPINQLNGCDDLFRSIMNTCNALNGAKKSACVAAAWATYWACMMG